jgi:predicted regulator of Ras-like GTPase activity (Roadblock/LC7/MglB family)
LNFQNILHDLVSSIPGAIGALFLDWEGETVEMLGARPFEADDHDLKIMGAYQGIFLTQLRQICERISAGTPHRFKVEFAKTKVLSCDLADGYYLVLVVDGGTNEGLAWQRMDGSRERLLAELS